MLWTDVLLVAMLGLGAWGAILIFLSFREIVSVPHYSLSLAGLKAIGASAVVVMVISQAYSMEAILGHLPRLGVGVGHLLRAHHWIGRLALTLAGAIGIVCMTEIGAGTTPLRAVVHESLGATAFLVAASKLALLRFRPDVARRVAPRLGRILALALIGIWFTSAFEYWTNSLH